MSKSINGYIFDESAIHETGSAQYWQARKGTTDYFFKRFKDPKRPSDRVSEAVRKQKNAICDDFARERKKVLTAIRACVGGNIIAPVEFFEYEKRYYQATEWRQIKAKTLKEISSFPEANKELLFKTAAQNLKVIHGKGIIHLDVKPDNLPVSVNEVSGKLVCTLIDFDSSYFEDSLPVPELTAATDPYMSPELAAYKMKDGRYGNKVSAKNDVFALAIVFHEYWTGRKFIFNGSDDIANGRYLYQAVDNNEKISLAPGVPAWLEALLRWMIRKNPSERPDMAEVLEALKDHSKIPGGGNDEEKARLEKEKLLAEKARLERERLIAEKARKEKEEKEKLERERLLAERARIERERLLAEQRRREASLGFDKGPNFPTDAVSFERLPNGNIKILYRDGSKMVYKYDIAIRKGLIIKG